MDQSIYLLYGQDMFLLEEFFKKLKKQFPSLENGINYITLSEENVSSVISEIETPCFGYEKKMIVIKNSNLFKKDGRKKSSVNGFSETLATYINENIVNIKQSVLLVFIEQEVDKNDLYKVIETNGIVKKFEEQKVPQLIAKMKSICNAYKVNVDESTLKYFIEVCGTNMQDLINEIRKLIEFAGENGNIDRQVVDLLSVKKIDSIIFDLTDYLGKKDVKNAIRVLNDLLYMKEPIQRILIMLYNHFKKLYIVKIAKEENKDIAQSLNLRPNQMFLQAKYLNQANSFTNQDIRNILDKFVKIDYESKIGLIDINIGLESILCSYCS